VARTHSSLPVVQSAADFPSADIKEKLRALDLRPTRQRIALAWTILRQGDRHVTAETLYDEAKRIERSISLPTVYNTLRQFISVGLLREVAIGASKAYFDTNISPHHHFFIEDKNELMDIPINSSRVDVPSPPQGYEVAHVDLVVRLRRRAGSHD